MAGREKHAERSHRSYKQRQASLAGFTTRTARKQAIKQNAKIQRANILQRLAGAVKKNRESKTQAQKEA